MSTNVLSRTPSHADDDAHHGQNDIFTEHIRAGFPGMEAEHLDDGNFPDAFAVGLMLPSYSDERECAGNEHERDDFAFAGSIIWSIILRVSVTTIKRPVIRRLRGLERVRRKAHIRL